MGLRPHRRRGHPEARTDAGHGPGQEAGGRRRPQPARPGRVVYFGGGDHHCDTCGAEFRTNTRLRQHQANAHRAS